MVTVDAPQVVLRGLTVTGSGSDLAVEDSASSSPPRAAGAVIEDNRLEGNLIGVNLKGPRPRSCATTGSRAATTCR